MPQVLFLPLAAWAALFDGDPSTFARFADSTPEDRAATCSFTVDFGEAKPTRGVRFVSQEDRRRCHSPCHVSVWADDVRVACVSNLPAAYALESTFVTWPRTTARRYRIEIGDAGLRAAAVGAMYQGWYWQAMDAWGVDHNRPDETPHVDIAELEFFDDLPEDCPARPTPPGRAFPRRRLEKDWLLQDFGFGGFAKAMATNGPAYYAVCEDRRRRRLARIAAECPQIVYVKHYTISGDAELTGNAQVSDESARHAFRNWRKGGQLCLLTVKPDGTVTNEVLLDRPNGCIRDPDVSFDGKRILFSMRESFPGDLDGLDGQTGFSVRRTLDRILRPDGDDYHLYVMDVETRKVTQLTFSDPARCADFEGVFVSDGSIVFQSTRCVQVIPCHRTESANLYACDGDGRNIRRLGYDGGATMTPQEMPDGRILYTRYEYNDRCARLQQPLFTMNPDGTGQEEYYGNGSRFPTSLFHFRPAPGSDKVLGIVGGHHAGQKGKLVLIDRALAVEGDAGITFVAGSSVEEAPGCVPSHYDTNAVYLAERRASRPFVDDLGMLFGAQWQNPYPLSEREWITGFQPEGTLSGTKCGENPNFGIYWQNADGERELLAYDPSISCSQPVPLRPRRRVEARRCLPWNPDTAYGVFHVSDVYEGPGMEGVKRGEAKTLRVVAIESRPAFIRNGSMYAFHEEWINPYVPYWGDNSGEAISAGGTWDVKHVLGEVPVEPDGSCTFEAPARSPIYFQLLDAEGWTIQTMRSWVTVMPGEYRSCVGCHESKLDAPSPKCRVTVKLRRLEPAPGQGRHPLLDRLDAGGMRADATNYLGVHARHASDPKAPTEGFSYPRLIQPILDRSCVKCHDGSAPDRPDLTGRRAADTRRKAGTGPLDPGRAFSRSYLCLTRNGFQSRFLNWPSSTGRSEMIPPRTMGSASSSFMDFLTPKHHGAETTETDRRLFACWIDLGVPFGGSYPEATEWTDEERAIYDYEQDKRMRFAEAELQSKVN